MQNSNWVHAEDLRIFQIIDANLDRAREGLRVIEDWSRFGLGDEKYVKRIKNFRQILGKNHLEIYKKSRNSIDDKCKGLTHKEQINRKTPQQIISSNAGRVQEALRVIEEFSRVHNNNLSKIASEIRYEIYTLEIELLSLSKCKNYKKILKENNLYVITDQKENLLEIVEHLLIAGVKIIQHRFKKGTDKDHLKEAIQIKNLCKRYNSLFIINDRVDIALASDADGIHLGQDDLDLNNARKLLGYSKIIGISANNKIDISNAINNGCDYIGIGPVFDTSTKKGKKPLGIDKIKTLTKDLNIPWFAIGGITTKKISILKSHGFKKVALVSQLMNSKDPKRDAMIILKELVHEN
ncbi:thiamine phosphate synthase [Prochlorococcus marinus XMU1411]|uniref:thiamine phosphate synthase n=1 Tax=Prochlorococcus marinus TaxID=1219 RepID=UPI001ADB2B7D|nr:thiamine phosphate synthase [Prochlorococcus marinus]MBO8244263.1 thiamine phosphate synthase [Prochlorococcus marinus XMU1411]MBW3055348.1 thiamine phosphate synthase [Prochlorococcus marinus str. MU1411]MCR8537091.1 thiamine phosphate synthase [Prochlorococcus marinus CUG1430]